MKDGLPVGAGGNLSGNVGPPVCRKEGAPVFGRVGPNVVTLDGADVRRVVGA